jgi:hypothetical protein
MLKMQTRRRNGFKRKRSTKRLRGGVPITYEDGDYEGDVDEAGKKHGKGKMTYNYGAIYDGTWENDEPNGIGKYSYPDRETTYEGEFKNGEFSGHGVYKSKPNAIIYRGEFKNDLRNGMGFLYSKGGMLYGEYKNDRLIRGTGKRRFGESDSTMEGDFENEKLKYGKRTWPNGDTYVGAFDKNGDIDDGKGVFTWASGWKYDGEYKDGLMHGFGVFTSPDGSVFEGQFKNDKKHKGTLTSPDGSVYKGYFKNNKKHGRGHLTLSNGTVSIGNFNQDRPPNPIQAQDAFLSGEDTD